MRRGDRLDNLLSGLAASSADELAQHLLSDDQSHMGVGWSLGCRLRQDSLTALHRALRKPAGMLFLALQMRGSAMGSPIQIGLDTGVAQLLDALGRFCDVEGLAASDLHSINFLEDEVEVVIVRADGSRRHNFYPMAAFGGAPIRRSGLPVVVPQKLPPSGDDTEV